MCRCNTCTNTINNDMIHFISSRDLLGSSILTSLALHRCVGPSAPSLSQASPPRGPSLHYLNLPFTLQPVHQAKPYLDLHHLGHMTPCHVLYAIKLLHCVITCELIPCALSQSHIISPPNVVTQLPKTTRDLSISPFLVIDGNTTKIWNWRFNSKLALHTSISC
jgi:uncharacterized Zn-finger protein